VFLGYREGHCRQLGRPTGTKVEWEGRPRMSVVGAKVWLVAVTEEPAEPEPGNPSMTGHFLYASAEGAGEGLRDILDEMGIDDMPPELLTETQFEEEIGTYHGSFTIDDKLISYIVAPLTINE